MLHNLQGFRRHKVVIVDILMTVVSHSQAIRLGVGDAGVFLPANFFLMYWLSP
jgi:hypothetical protein